jgi:DNA-directed RNA polymerase specialized sigma24 family protein
LMPEFATEQRSPADRAVANDVSRIVSAALAQMDQSHRVAVVLSDVEELPMAQVGEVLDIGDSAAKMRAHRGRGSLRAILHPKEVVDAL